MKNTFKFLFLGLALLSVATLSQAAETKIGVVDVQLILQKSDDIKTARDNLEKKFSARRNTIISLQKNLKEDMDKLNRDNAVMSEVAKAELQGKVMKERRKLEGLGQDFQQDFNLAEREELKKFYEKLETAITKVAKAGSYDLVIQKRAASFASERADITASVLKEIE